jgi:hypothetical protein
MNTIRQMVYRLLDRIRIWPALNIVIGTYFGLAAVLLGSAWPAITSQGIP